MWMRSTGSTGRWRRCCIPAMEDFAIDIMLGKGSCRPVHPAGASEVYAGGGHHHGRAANGAAPGPFRRDSAAGILLAGGALRDRKTVGEGHGRGDRGGGRLGDRKDDPGARRRLANRLLKRVRDFAQVKYDGVITKAVADFALDILDVDRLWTGQQRPDDPAHA